MFMIHLEKVLKDYTSIVKMEQQSLADTNKTLRNVLLTFNSKENLPAVEIDMYFRAL